MNLGDFDELLCAKLLVGARALKLNRAEFVYARGDAADRVYFVRSGRVKIVRANAAGAEVIVGIRNSGDIFGELAWMSGVHRQTWASAMEPTHVDAISAETFAHILRSDGAIARGFARGIARRLADAELELTELAGKSVPGRLVDVLGRLASEHGVEEPDGTLRIGINLTHKDLADLIGTSRETLTKELSVLADVGLLRVAHKTVTLVQPQAFPFARLRESS